MEIEQYNCDVALQALQALTLQESLNPIVPLK